MRSYWKRAYSTGKWLMQGWNLAYSIPALVASILFGANAKAAKSVAGWHPSGWWALAPLGALLVIALLRGHYVHEKEREQRLTEIEANIKGLQETLAAGSGSLTGVNVAGGTNTSIERSGIFQGPPPADPPPILSAEELAERCEELAKKLRAIEQERDDSEPRWQLPEAAADLADEVAFVAKELRLHDVFSEFEEGAVLLRQRTGDLESIAQRFGGAALRLRHSSSKDAQ
jgi:hypothetical protein